VVLGIADFLPHPFDDRRGSRQIRVADTQVDDVHSAGDDLLLHFIDRGEQVRRQGLDPARGLYGKSGHAVTCSFRPVGSCSYQGTA